MLVTLESPPARLGRRPIASAGIVRLTEAGRVPAAARSEIGLLRYALVKGLSALAYPRSATVHAVSPTGYTRAPMPVALSVKDQCYGALVSGGTRSHLDRFSAR